MCTQFRIDGNMPTQYVVSTARDWAVRCTWPRGITGFTCAFQNLQGKFSTVIATFNFQPWFVISASNTQPLFSTTISTFNWQFSLSTLNCDSNCQLRLKFSTVISTFNCDYNFKLRLQLSTVIQLFNAQLRFQFLNVIRHFSIFNCDSNFQPRFAISASVIPTPIIESY